MVRRLARVFISICCGRTVTMVTVRPQTCSGLSYADEYDKPVLTLPTPSECRRVLLGPTSGWVRGVGVSRAFF